MRANARRTGFAIVGALLTAAAWSFLGPLAARAAESGLEFPIYDGGLAAGWQDWSWAKHELRSSAQPYNGKPAIRFVPAGWQGIYLHVDGLRTNGYTMLEFWVHGGGAGGQKIVANVVYADRSFGPRVPIGIGIATGKIPRDRWTLCILTLTRLNAANRAITGFAFQDASGKLQEPVYLAGIRLAGPAAKGPDHYTVDVDVSVDVHAISPEIYGVAAAGPEYIRDLRIGLNRWGGNNNTRYNWERGNCWNAARDWEFRNGNYGMVGAEDRSPSGPVDRFAANNRAAGVATLLTIPTIGFVARDDNNATRSVGVPASGGNPVGNNGAVAGYDPAENRRKTSVRSFARKRAPFTFPPDLNDDAVYQDEWVDHLVKKFGKANAGGVRYYAMDNEPDLWSSTHTDIHPVTPSYDDMLGTFLEYAAAVKDVDPTAKVTGPVSWGWTGYFYSPRDTGKWTDRPDRKAHGDLPFIPWFLKQAREHEKRTGRRLLDVLDIHFYPQGAGVYAGKTDPQTDALRLRSTRALWDPTYVDESWIASPVKLIPRMKAWIQTYYPGTRLGITEWNWGADSTMNGALAVAECLGVFGREAVDLANYWTAPPTGSPGYLAFKLYRNADGLGASFGDRSVRATSSAPEDVSAFASVVSTTKRPALMLLNKRADRPASVIVTIRRGSTSTAARLFRLDASDPKHIAGPVPLTITGGRLKIVLPPSSISLVQCR